MWKAYEVRDQLEKIKNIFILPFIKKICKSKVWLYRIEIN